MYRSVLLCHRKLFFDASGLGGTIDLVRQVREVLIFSGAPSFFELPLSSTELAIVSSASSRIMEMETFSRPRRFLGVRTAAAGLDVRSDSGLLVSSVFSACSLLSVSFPFARFVLGGSLISFRSVFSIPLLIGCFLSSFGLFSVSWIS